MIRRVADRVTAAGRSIDPARLERVVRQVLDRLPARGVHAQAGSGRDAQGTRAAEARRRPGSRALLVFVLEAATGAAALAALREEIGAAARRAGAQLLAAHTEPFPETPASGTADDLTGDDGE
ncbi:MAG: hypothetical protein HY703_00230 [Gemmatimonadetes bacterium]|nr:hypothetical protein [Gemmatimonadota bacterium]